MADGTGKIIPVEGIPDTAGDAVYMKVTNGSLAVGSSPNFVGTAAECQTQANTLSTTDVGVYTFFATDTNQYGTLSAHDGASTGTITWETTAGAANIHVSSGMDARGNYPATWYYQDTKTTEAADVFYTSGDISMYNHFEMNVTVIDTGNVTVSVSIDGTTYSDIILIDRSTEALFASAAITATGQYYFDGKFKNLKVTSSAADTHTIIFAHSVI